MGKKQTKRTRKFISQGGVKARLQKGTITSKGSLKRKHSSKKSDGEDAALKRAKMMGTQYADEKQKKRDDADFVSEKNLGELDMESFFETFGEDDDAASDGEEEVMSDDQEEASSEDEDDDKASSGKKGDSSDERSDSEADEEDILEAERRMKEEMKKLLGNRYKRVVREAVHCGEEPQQLDQRDRGWEDPQPPESRWRTPPRSLPG